MLDGVGLEAVRLHAQTHAEGAREGAQHEQVVVAVEVGEDLVVVVADPGGGGGVEHEDVLLVHLEHRRQVGPQVVARAPLELLEQPRRPDRRVGLDLEGVLEEVAAGPAQQAPHGGVEDAVLPQVDDGLRARGAEVVDDEGAGVGVQAPPRAPGRSRGPSRPAAPRWRRPARPARSRSPCRRRPRRSGRPARSRRAAARSGRPGRACGMPGRRGASGSWRRSRAPTTGSGRAPSKVAPASTSARPWTSSVQAASSSGVIVETAAGQEGPTVMSTRTPRRSAWRRAALTPATQDGVPQPWVPRSISMSRARRLWVTSATSRMPKPASATWSTSRAISAGSTLPCGHHQRKPAAVASPGRAKSRASARGRPSATPGVAGPLPRAAAAGRATAVAPAPAAAAPSRARRRTAAVGAAGGTAGRGAWEEGDVVFRARLNRFTGRR